MKAHLFVHRNAYTVLVCATAVWIGCCCFPIIDVAANRPNGQWELTLLGYWVIGTVQGLLWNRLTWWKIAALNGLLTAFGLLARVPLDLGTAANLYGLTPENIAVHFLAAAGIPALSAFAIRAIGPAEGRHILRKP